jgi:Uma2 family endonuclease
VENKPTMIADRPRLTAEAFFEIAQLPENQDRRLELEDGEIVTIPPAYFWHSVTGGLVCTELCMYMRQHPEGYVLAASAGYKLSSFCVRYPTVSYVSKSRMPRLDDEFEGAPDLAVEVVAPNEDWIKKAREYFKAGARIVWAVYTDEQIVLVLTPKLDGGYDVRELGIDDTLDGGDVLPGFSVAVNVIFPTE